MPRVAAIGLDAAEAWWIEKLMADGQLPHLSALRERSARVPLKTARAYRADIAWSQFITGRDAASTNYWGTGTFDPATYLATLQGSYDGPAFYSGNDVVSVVFDVPDSVIRRDVRGIQVTAWGAHAPQYPRASLPAGLLRQIDERFGTHPAYLVDSDVGWNDAAYLARFAENLHIGAGRRAAAGRWLLEQQPDWELFFTVLSETHSGGHHLWHGVEPEHPLAGVSTASLAGAAMLKVSQAVDAAVGTLVESLPADTAVCVFSVHGMAASFDVPSLVLIPELLHRLHTGRAYLRDRGQARWLRRGMPPIDPVHRYPWAIMGSLYDQRPDRPLAQRIAAALPPSLHRGLRKLMRKPAMPGLGVISSPVPAESTLPPEELLAQMRGQSFEFAAPMWYAAQWPTMSAFVLPSFSGDAHIRINVTGRERDGIVSPAEFRAAGERVIAEVARCTDPRTGKPILADVEWMRSAPEDNGPDADLIIAFDGPCDALRHPDVGLIGPFSHQRTGGHTTNGFALISGPGIAVGDLPEQHALDLPATLLDLLGRQATSPLSGSSFAGDLRTPALR